jgi:hypothetical protein
LALFAGVRADAAAARAAQVISRLLLRSFVMGRLGG